MSATLFNDAPIPLEAQIEEVEREIAMRQHVYPRCVADGKMKQAAADRALELMRAVRNTLRTISTGTDELIFMGRCVGLRRAGQAMDAIKWYEWNGTGWMPTIPDTMLRGGGPCPECGMHNTHDTDCGRRL